MTRVLALLVPVSLLVGCGNGVASEDAARLAYEGLDPAVSIVMQLGFDGFNSADSANIATQTAEGSESGTITVDGQVDQGASANKGMRLTVVLADWSDGSVTTTEDEELFVTYSTAEDAALDVGFSLKGVPDGTLEGTISGAVEMSGDLEGELTLDLVIAGELESNGAEGTRRVDGATTVTGTAVSDYGEYAVDFSL